MPNSTKLADLHKSGMCKLGLLPPSRKQIARRLQFRDYAPVGALPAPPAAVSYYTLYPDARMMGNDRLGDCVIAGRGHQCLQWSGVSGNPYDITLKEIEDSYFRQTGGADSGLDIMSSLDDWRKVPFGGNLLNAYVSINPSDATAIEQAISVFGGATTGVNLPLAWQGQSTWTAPPGGRAPRLGNWAPGSWGGHDVSFLGYDAKYFYCRSWGELVPIERAAVPIYFSEIYCLVNELWINKVTQQSVGGFKFADLQADLSLVTSA